MQDSMDVHQMHCPVCMGKQMITDDVTGEHFCSKCGFVHNDRITDTGAEWRSFPNEEHNRARTGANTSLAIHDMGLSTVIGTANKDSAGKPLAAGIKSSIGRLRTWDSRTHARTSSDKNLRQALGEMNKLKDKLALSDAVITHAAYIYRKAMDKKLVKGRTIHGLAAACMYAACRNAETPRTLDDIANGMNMRRKDVARCYRLIFRELDLKVPVVDPIKGISRIASLVGLSEKTQRIAARTLDLAKKKGLVAGKDPMGLAAAALYLACVSSGENKTQKDISVASGVTEVTVRNRCAGLKMAIDE